MLLSSTRSASDIFSKSRNSFPHSGKSASELTAAEKTNQHNNFLSMLATETVSRTDSRGSAHNTLKPLGPDAEIDLLSKKREREDLQAGAPESKRRARLVQANGSNGETVKHVDSFPETAELTGSAKSSVRPAPGDQDIEQLIQDLNSKVILRDHAVASSRLLKPRVGYDCELHETPDNIQSQRVSIRDHLKRKRTNGNKSDRRSRPERGGYSPQDMISFGAIAKPQSRSSDLDNEIHPLLSRSRFDDTPDTIYDELLPALRLASLFLTQPCCLRYWVTLALATRVPDSAMSKKFNRSCQRIPALVPLTEINVTTVTNRLRQMGESNLIHFRFKDRLHIPACKTAVMGLSSPICDFASSSAHTIKNGSGERMTRSMISLHSDAYVSLLRLSRLQFPETSQVLRFHFFVAVLLIHELAHSIEGAHIRQRGNQYGRMTSGEVYMEPFWLDWTRIPEAGTAWEETLFGGEICPVNRRMDGQEGISISDWPPRGTSDDPERRTFWSVPMAYIEKVFQKKNWEARGNNGDWLKIPRTGACSLYANHLTTMTAAEMRKLDGKGGSNTNIAEDAPPPEKVRVKASGCKEEKRSSQVNNSTSGRDSKVTQTKSPKDSKAAIITPEESQPGSAYSFSSELRSLSPSKQESPSPSAENLSGPLRAPNSKTVDQKQKLLESQHDQSPKSPDLSPMNHNSPTSPTPPIALDFIADSELEVRTTKDSVTTSDQNT